MPHSACCISTTAPALSIAALYHDDSKAVKSANSLELDIKVTLT